ncbi:hypothetical protein SDC9_61508 [bioreactor metagenome]|uniref:Uncharacterized protein n=1 Tax=bioreactor metagenome TaxID=1076179 RepID=A0A644XFZ2_9ZZZZ
MGKRRIAELSGVVGTSHGFGKIRSLQVGAQNARPSRKLHSLLNPGEIRADGFVGLRNGRGAEGRGSKPHLAFGHPFDIARAHAVEPFLPVHMDVHKTGREEHSAHILPVLRVIQHRDDALFKGDSALLQKIGSVEDADIPDGRHLTFLLKDSRIFAASVFCNAEA